MIITSTSYWTWRKRIYWTSNNNNQNNKWYVLLFLLLELMICMLNDECHTSNITTSSCCFPHLYCIVLCISLGWALSLSLRVLLKKKCTMYLQRPVSTICNKILIWYIGSVSTMKFNNNTHLLFSPYSLWVQFIFQFTSLHFLSIVFIFHFGHLILHKN